MTRGVKIADGELVEDIKRVAGEVGRKPTKQEYDSRGEYSSATASKRFGSWNDALQECGFSPRKKGSAPGYNEERLERLSHCDEAYESLRKAIDATERPVFARRRRKLERALGLVESVAGRDLNELPEEGEY